MAHDELDGGVVGRVVRGRCRCARLPDDQVSPLGARFGEDVAIGVAGPWPGIGRARAVEPPPPGMRLTAADAYLSVPMTVGRRCGSAATPRWRLIVEKGRVVGVRLDTGKSSRAGEVIVCGGTLGTAELLAGAGVVSSTLPFYEHREVLVRYRARTVVTAAPAIPPTVAHTADRAEIRCYADDFGRFIPECRRRLPRSVLSSRWRRAGRAPWPGTESALTSRRRRWECADAAIDSVVEALSSPDLAGLVVDGSVHVDDRSSDLPACVGQPGVGKRTDWPSTGVPGLRVIDGSILPNVRRPARDHRDGRGRDRRRIGVMP